MNQRLQCTSTFSSLVLQCHIRVRSRLYVFVNTLTFLSALFHVTGLNEPHVCPLLREAPGLCFYAWWSSWCSIQKHPMKYSRYPAWCPLCQRENSVTSKLKPLTAVYWYPNHSLVAQAKTGDTPDIGFICGEKQCGSFRNDDSEALFWPCGWLSMRITKHRSVCIPTCGASGWESDQTIWSGCCVYIWQMTQKEILVQLSWKRIQGIATNMIKSIAMLIGWMEYGATQEKSLELSLWMIQVKNWKWE